MEERVETEAVWQEAHDRLLSYIRRHVPSIQDAEDILQDVFARIHQNLSKVQDARSVSAWVYRITRNAITDHHRARAAAAGAVQRLAEASEDAGPSADEPEATRQYDSQPTPEFSRYMLGLVKQLPDRYAEAIEMVELGDMSQKAAAELLGISVSGMKSRVQRGRQKLRDLLLDCCAVELDRRGGMLELVPRDGCKDCGCTSS